MPGSNPLRKPEPHEVKAVQQLLKRCKSPNVKASDLRGWESVLMDEKCNPLSVMRVQRQRENDCQGQSATVGGECRRWYTSGRSVVTQLSDMYAYNASEYLMSPSQVGKNQGTSIHSGIRLQVDGIPSLGVKPGIATEADWPYSQYCRSRSQFEQLAKRLKIEDTSVAEVIAPPPFRDMLALTAAGATLHMGTYWGPSYQSQLYDGKRLVKHFPGPGNGGHATEGIWGKKYDRVGWLLAVWNSHGDGYYLIDENEYERLRASKFAPFEAYVLQPENVVERYDRITQGGGYFA